MKQLVLREPAAVITATGPDAFAFLQSQGSQDLRSLRPGDSTYGLWLDRKGRIQGDSHILRLAGETFLLISHATPAGLLLDRLQANLVADEVDFADITAGHLLLVSWGADAESLPEGKFVTETNGRVRSWAGRLAGGPSVEHLGPAPEMAVLCHGLKERGWHETSSSALESERVFAGIPMVPIDAGPDTLPQEAGLETTAVSFTKGCYLGQEVMARLHSIGKVQRGLKKLRLACPAAVLPAPVLTPDGRELGLLTSQAERLGSWNGLGILSLRHLPANGTVLVEGLEAQVVE